MSEANNICEIKWRKSPEVMGKSWSETLDEEARSELTELILLDFKFEHAITTDGVHLALYKDGILRKDITKLY